MTSIHRWKCVRCSTYDRSVRGKRSSTIVSISRRALRYRKQWAYLSIRYDNGHRAWHCRAPQSTRILEAKGKRCRPPSFLCSRERDDTEPMRWLWKRKYTYDQDILRVGDSKAVNRVQNPIHHQDSAWFGSLKEKPRMLTRENTPLASPCKQSVFSTSRRTVSNK